MKRVRASPIEVTPHGTLNSLLNFSQRGCFVSGSFRCCVGASRTLVIGAIAAALWVTIVDARVTKIVIESTLDPDTTLAATGPAGAIKRISGRAYGELDPKHPGNAIIQDISLAPRNAAGKVEYVSTFQLIMPSDPAKMSGLMWHDVPNRGGRLTIVPAERNVGDVGLSSGWQGENAGNTAYNKPGAEFVIVPVAKNADGSPIRGEVLGRIVNRSGPNSQPLMVQVNPLPYKPFDLDTKKATLTVVKHETVGGKVTIDSVMPSSDWAWAKCDAANPFPGTPDATQICLKNGFNPKLLYQVVFTAQDPPVLGIGFAAFRDVASFFRNEAKDDFGTANPLAGKIEHVISRGNSQSGNYLRGFIHLGFNQDEAGRQVHDGAWPIIAGRRIALNFRWAQADGVLELYQAGSEGPQWWVPWPDTVRKLPERGILDRCTATKTCPKVIEHFGSAEVWALKLTPEWVGTDGKADIPLPDNVRRYYIASSNHGGYVVPTPNTMFNASLAGSTLPAPNCPGNNFGTAVLAPNVMPHIQTVNALRQHFRNWVMKGVAPPPSVWPRLDKGELVDATKASMGFPTIPGIPATLPSNFIMPTFDYDWGPDFNANDGSGVPTKLPPPIKQVINMKVPRVNADGNEVGGVPVVLHDAPLGTYLGWNITAGGARPFHEGQICNYVGGMVPFAKTKADRVAANDSRLSLEERYTDHAGYVAAVRKAAANAVVRGFLLQADADALIAQADASNVLRP